MVRPAKCLFATTFLTLKRFHIHKACFRKVFTSEEFNGSQYAKEQVGKEVEKVGGTQEEQDKVSTELSIYTKAEGIFGLPTVVRHQYMVS
ncbi:hypothetical protein ACH5RR_021620 [Cinchona calisaya]|uniref:Glutathione S-transferase n=1 Tax=Cinchona calisaya TaxID=153742 RepID=A0ABD2ZHU8_9GENT